MSSALQFELLDLRHFSAGSLRPLLNEESRIWSERLHWDYRGSAELLLQYLDSRVLPGYVAVENGRIVGYVFCVYEGHKAVIGDVFAMPGKEPAPGAQDPATGQDDPAAEIRAELLLRLLEMLKNTPGVTRIESQLLLHAHGSHQHIFEDAGFEVHERIFMEWPLHPDSIQQGAAQFTNGNEVHLPPGIELRRWLETDLSPAARLIAASYEGHKDSHINEQYRTAAGSQRFLHNIVRFPGCGYFDAESSLALIEQGSTELAGLLLCSRVRDDVGHVTQICIAPKYRGRGLGRMLLVECAQSLAKRNFTLLTLTVTASNSKAVSLYEWLGFRGTHRFDAMVWDISERMRLRHRA
ncbi:MAG TPA: GNAT family N-acetyltransferase [Acidobacteriaceae bacterium]|jgi:ribosomal protein S18 acetylase RimI-like enzyme|nr:GNAT family N-acetyltransferase [Acidobacteriaceae bacterium]